jgi:dTDP-glucose pyrophosphorylase
MMDHIMTNEFWRKTLLPDDATLKQAISNLDASALQIIMVVSSDNLFLGTITDGDIRRGLLRGLTLDSSIESIISRDPLVAPPQWSRESVLELMKANKRYHLPIVSDKRCVVGLHCWDELVVPKERANIMVIMAGGQGSRLKPFTEKCPKPLLLVDGKPMLEHIIVRARENGFKHFVLAIKYLGHMIESYFGDGSWLQVKIEYLREETPLGTAGALSLLSSFSNEPIVVSNCDVLTDINYGELLDFHKQHAACATMAVRLYEWNHPFGVVRTKGVDIVGFEEKPTIRNHVNAGIYVLNSSALEYLKVGQHCDMPTLFTRLQANSFRAIVYPMHEPWLDVGRVEDLKKAQRSISVDSSEEMTSA